jgi:glycosyltransferase involved in cell wall biosynthesis
MLALATRLPRDRFDVEFIVLTERGQYAAAAETAGIRVRNLGTGRRGPVPLPLFAIRAAAKAVRFVVWCRRSRYDILDAWLFHAYALGAATRPITRIPVFISGRRSLSDFKEHFGPFDRALDALARRSSDVIVANSEQVAADVIKRERADPSKLRVIRNGVDIPDLMDEDTRAALRQAWGFHDDQVVIGCVANYKRGKGLELILDVAAAVRTRIPNARYVLVGEGNIRPLLEQTTARHGLRDIVRLHGPEPDARDLYGAFDIVLQASETEGLPNVLLEAAAAGRAIIATAAGGTEEIVQNNRTGILIPIGDGASMSLALEILVRDPVRREQLGKAARDHVRNVFSMQRFLDETAALYEELAARKGIR